MSTQDDNPFKDLRNKKLLPKNYTISMKIWFANQILEGKSTIAELQNMYGLNPSTAKKYVRLARQGILPQVSYGHPKRIADDQLDFIKSEIKRETKKLETAHGRNKVINCLPDEIFQKVILQAACSSEESRGKAPVAPPLSKRTKCWRNSANRLIR